MWLKVGRGAMGKLLTGSGRGKTLERYIRLTPKLSLLDLDHLGAAWFRGGATMINNHQSKYLSIGQCAPVDLFPIDPKQLSAGPVPLLALQV